MKILQRYRAKIRDRLARRLGVPDIRFALERLAENGFRANTVLDVGAYRGDFARLCLTTWPECLAICFEALEERVTELRALEGNSGRIQVFDCLIGAATADRVPLHMRETASSVLTEHHDQTGTTRDFKMRTIDEIIAENFASRPISLLKIDVQGYELEVLKGTEQTLPSIQVILLETNLLDIHRNVPLLAEVAEWLNSRGFVAYDICGLTRRPLDKALWQADLIFVPKESPLRSDKRWGA